MNTPEFYQGTQSPNLDLESIRAVKSTDRVLAWVNQNSGRYSEAKPVIDALEGPFEVLRLYTVNDPDADFFTNLGANVNNFCNELNDFHPDMIQEFGGDWLAVVAVNGLYEAHKREQAKKALDPDYETIDILSTPLMLLPFGSGNDSAWSLSKSNNPSHIFRFGKQLAYRPAKITITEEDGTQRVVYAAANFGIGVTGSVMNEINHPKTHNHRLFKKRLGRDLLMLLSGAKGVIKAKPFNAETKDETTGEFGEPTQIFGSVFVHSRRFGKFARTRARFSQPNLRGTEISKKYSLKTALNLGLFTLGSLGIVTPTKPVTQAVEFRVTQRKRRILKRRQNYIFASIDDTEIRINDGSIIRVELAEDPILLYSDRKRP